MAQPYEQLKLGNQICFPLYACARRIVNRYTPFLKPLGLTYTQYIVFMVLWEEEQVTVGELGKRLHLDAGTLTPLLKNLEKNGYITRARSKEDERVTQITLTKKGDALKEDCKDIPYKLSSGCTPLSPQDAAELYRLLYALLEE
ncbi:MAG: MarR family transcriptional regulator [Lachnospiraceae bacterium]|nr:MarR family transcriptional regulator [Lachnospiraceae bacterium]